MFHLTLRMSRSEIAGAVVLCLTVAIGAMTDRSLCLWQAVTGSPCPGCGITRALVVLACGDWRGAMQLNASSLVVGPLLLVAALRRVGIQPAAFQSMNACGPREESESSNAAARASGDGPREPK